MKLSDAQLRALRHAAAHRVVFPGTETTSGVAVTITRDTLTALAAKGLVKLEMSFYGARATITQAGRAALAEVGS